MTTQVVGATFRYSHTIGRRETAGPGFHHPCAIAVREDGQMYVASRSEDNRVQGKRITICTVDEEYIGEFAKAGRGAALAELPLVWPAAIALDREGQVYISDEWHNRISIYSGDGEWIGQWGTPGSGQGELSAPAGLAFDAEDNLYVVDSGNNRIQKFTQDGKLLDQWGHAGSGDGEFNLPFGIEVDGNGDVYVADWRNDRIQKFAPDGRFLMKIGASGIGDGEFNRPMGVAVDTEGIIYVADWGNDRLQVFDADGRFITKIYGDATISKWGQMKLDADPEILKERQVAQGLEREKLFWGPMAVEVDKHDRIFVVDCIRHRVQVYRKLSPYFLGLYDGGRL